MDRFQEAAEAATSLESLLADFYAVETAIADCMDERGFEYVPQNLEAEGLEGSLSVSLYLEGPESVPDGYGNVVAYKRAVALGESEAGRFESLPANQRDAFRQALYGDGTRGGCSAVGAQAAPMRRARAEFIEQFNELHERVAADPQWTEANTEWSQCMRERGFDFSDQLAARRHVDHRIESELGSPREFSEKDETTFDEIAEEDRLIARADAVCQQEQGDEFWAVWEKHVEDFVTQHSGLIRDLVDSGPPRPRASSGLSLCETSFPRRIGAMLMGARAAVVRCRCWGVLCCS